MRRAVLMWLLVVLICPLGAAVASPALRYRNPLREGRTGKALRCADPHVIDVRKGPFRYFMACTTDYARNGIALHKSRDLVHWHPAGFVFPHGRHPWWSHRRFWAPEIYRIENRWVVYFAASLDRSKANLPVRDGTMALGVASSRSLRGPWRTRIVNYRRQADASAVLGGTIDPSVVRSPRDGQLYLFWAVQPNQIWAGRLSPDGLFLRGRTRRVLTPSRPWECHPNCVIEAPEPFYMGRTLNLLYSGASTWDGSYAVGLALGTDPLKGAYWKVTQPILHGGGGFVATGHTSQPVTGPDGRTYILYHALTSADPGHVSGQRMLMLGRLFGTAGRMVVRP